jgi:hypothetical protein
MSRHAADVVVDEKLLKKINSDEQLSALKQMLSVQSDKQVIDEIQEFIHRRIDEIISENT